MHRSWYLTFIAGAMLLAACVGQPTPTAAPPPTATDTPMPTATFVPSATPTPPPTATLVPTITLTPTPPPTATTRPTEVKPTLTKPPEAKPTPRPTEVGLPDTPPNPWIKTEEDRQHILDILIWAYQDMGDYKLITGQYLGSYVDGNGVLHIKVDVFKGPDGETDSMVKITPDYPFGVCASREGQAQLIPVVVVKSSEEALRALKKYVKEGDPFAMTIVKEVTGPKSFMGTDVTIITHR